MLATVTGIVSIIMRQWRIVLIAALALVLLLFIVPTTPATDQLRVTAHKLVQSSRPDQTHIFRGEAVWEDAHNYTDADDLLPHFRAVTQLPGMPISIAKSGCGWSEASPVNLQFSYDESRPDEDDTGWMVQDMADTKISFIRQQWQYFVSHEMLPWSVYKDKHKGRGIIIPAGHERSVQRLQVTLILLSNLNTSLPIEIAFWGGEELPEEVKQGLMALTPLKLYFNDLSRKDLPFPTFYSASNYHLKTPAILNSRFAEVLLLDSDNLPVMDPTHLFESEVYQQYGSILWPDIVRTRPNNPIWPIVNMRCREDEWETESGQLLISINKFFYHLQLAQFFESFYISLFRNIMLGDKDLIRMSFHALRTKYGRPARWLTLVGTVSPGEDGTEKSIFCGHSFAQHAPEKAGKVAFLHGGLLKTLKPEVIAWQLTNSGGLFQAYKRANDDSDTRATPQVSIQFDPAHYLNPKPENFLTGWCSDLPSDPARPLDEIAPGFEQKYHEAGGYWMLHEALRSGSG